jgi:DNA-binding transcriptional ArsR family regulator
MARAPADSDVYNAIADAKRRRIIDLLAETQERDVSDLVRSLRMRQPAVSKHLSVLRQVRLVSVNRRGRRRMYRLNAGELRQVHDWISTFERFWSHQIDRIKARAEEKARQLTSQRSAQNQEK